MALSALRGPGLLSASGLADGPAGSQHARGSWVGRGRKQGPVAVGPSSRCDRALAFLALRRVTWRGGAGGRGWAPAAPLGLSLARERGLGGRPVCRRPGLQMWVGLGLGGPRVRGACWNPGGPSLGSRRGRFSALVPLRLAS